MIRHAPILISQGSGRLPRRRITLRQCKLFPLRGFCAWDDVNNTQIDRVDVDSNGRPWTLYTSGGSNTIRRAKD